MPLRLTFSGFVHPFSLICRGSRARKIASSIPPAMWSTQAMEPWARDARPRLPSAAPSSGPPRRLHAPFALPRSRPPPLDAPSRCSRACGEAGALECSQGSRRPMALEAAGAPRSTARVSPAVRSTPFPIQRRRPSPRRCPTPAAPAEGGSDQVVQLPADAVSPAFCTNSLFMDMPDAPKVLNMLSFSALTPYYTEPVLFSIKEIEEENEDGVSTLFYLQKIYPDEWKNFEERVGWDEELKENEDLKEELRLWASYRGQTLSVLPPRK